MSETSQRNSLLLVVFVAVLLISMVCGLVNCWARANHFAVSWPWIDFSSRGFVRMAVFFVFVPMFCALLAKLAGAKQRTIATLTVIPLLMIVCSEVSVARDDMKANAFFNSARANGTGNVTLYWNRRSFLSGSLVTSFPDGSFVTSD